MTREESVKVLTEMQFAERTDFAEDPLFAFGYSKEYHALEYAIDALNSLPHWIPCSERLPETDGKYLCCWQGRSIETGMFLNGHFRLYGEIRDNLVTAWMPLPELYRGEDT